jgi:hypothetical protein
MRELPLRRHGIGGLLALFCFLPTPVAAQAPIGATLKLDGSAADGWALPATVELTVTGPGQPTFSGSNGKQERGAPLFSAQVEPGATFYRCDTVRGFPQRIGNFPFPNRLGASSFIAVKKDATGQTRVWVNASMGAWRIQDVFVSDWEYQIRYFSGDTNTGTPKTLQIGTVPNANFFAGQSIAGQVEVKYPEAPDLAGEIGNRLNFPNGYLPGAVGSISVLLTNRGVGRITQDFEIGFYLSSSPVLDRSTALPLGTLAVRGVDIPAGGSHLVTSDPLRIPAARPPLPFYFLAALDLAGAVSESDTSNNLVSAPALVPDLATAAGTLKFNFVDPRPGTVGSAEMTVSNKGDMAYKGPLFIEISVSERLLGQSTPVGNKRVFQGINLPPGQSVSLAIPDVEIPKTILTRLAASPETIYWLAKVEGDPQIEELNSANNSVAEGQQIRGFSFAGRVVTKGGQKPVKDVEVRMFLGREYTGSTPPSRVVASARTDASGSYRMEGLPYDEGYLLEPFKDAWTFEGGAFGRGVWPVFGDQLLRTPDVQIPDFLGSCDIRVLSVLTPYKGTPCFLDGASLNVNFEFDFDWGSHDPDRVIFTVKGADQLDLHVTGDHLSQAIDVGNSFWDCGTFQVYAVGQDRARSLPVSAGFSLVGKHPNNSLKPWGANPLFYKTTRKLVLVDLLQSCGIEKIPVFGGQSINLKWIPEIETELLNTELTDKYNWKLHEFETRLGPLELSLEAAYSSVDRFDFGDCAWQNSEKALSVALKGTTTLLPGTVKLPGYGQVKIVFAPGPVPIPIFFTFDFKPEGAALFKLKSDAPLFLESGNAEMKLGLKATGQIGLPYLATGGGWVEGAYELGGEFLPDPHWTKSVIYCQGGYTYTVFGHTTERGVLRWQYDFLSGKSEVVEPTTTTLSLEGLQPMNRSYLEDPGYAAWTAGRGALRLQNLGPAALQGPAASPIMTQVFPDSQASSSAAAEALGLAWLLDQPGRAPINRTAVMFSRFDGTAWAAPAPIADDGTADFHPSLQMLPDGSALAAWEDAHAVLPPAAVLTDLVRSLEISVARFDPGARKWGPPWRLTTNAFFDHTPRIVQDGNKAEVLWIANPSNHWVGSATQPNELWLAAFDGSKWSAPERVALIPRALLGFDAALAGDTLQVVMSLDLDDSLRTLTDHELFTIARKNGVWNTLTRLTTDDTPDDAPRLAALPSGELRLVWLKGGELLSAPGVDLNRRQVVLAPEYSGGLANFQLTANAKGVLAALWSQPGTHVSDLWANFYDPITDSWSKPKPLTADDEVEQGATVAFASDGVLTAVYNRKRMSLAPALAAGPGLRSAPGASPIQESPTDLYFLHYPLKADISLKGASLIPNPANPAPGDAVDLRVTVVNGGDWAVTNVPVVFYQGDPARGGVEIGRTRLAQNLGGGSEADVSVRWTTPKVDQPQRVYAVVDPAQTLADSTPTNNTATVVICRPDLAIGNFYWTQAPSNHLAFTVTVLNAGVVASSTATLELRSGTAAGTLAARPVPAIPAGASIDLTWEIDLSAVAATLDLTAELIGLVHDLGPGNNSMSLRLPGLSKAPVLVAAGTMRAGHNFEVRFNSVEGRSYRLEWSTDLRTWTEARPVTATGPFTVVAEPAPPLVRQRFFRVRQL